MDTKSSKPAAASQALTHIDGEGKARMVDVSDKPKTLRSAVARARIHMQPETALAISENRLKKGDALSVARMAGVMAAKRCSDLIPLCHPLPLTHVDVQTSVGTDHVGIIATARCTGRTGVEMEALTAASVAALTIYDMAKAIDRAMTIGGIVLVEKRGGQSGDFRRNEP